MSCKVRCPICGAPVPWFFEAFGMHPGCAQQRADEEGCGAVFAALVAGNCSESERADNGA